MNFKVSLVSMGLTLGLAILAGSFMVPALAQAPDKPSTHPGYNGLDRADEVIHEQGPGLFSPGDVEFHTGTGQGGFCVSGVCPPR
jgi:hypothetical protein